MPQEFRLEFYDTAKGTICCLIAAMRVKVSYKRTMKASHNVESAGDGWLPPLQVHRKHRKLYLAVEQNQNVTKELLPVGRKKQTREFDP